MRGDKEGEEGLIISVDVGNPCKFLHHLEGGGRFNQNIGYIGDMGVDKSKKRREWRRKSCVDIQGKINGKKKKGKTIVVTNESTRGKKMKKKKNETKSKKKIKKIKGKKVAYQVATRMLLRT